jgi:hypothetical protein
MHNKFHNGQLFQDLLNFIVITKLKLVTKKEFDSNSSFSSEWNRFIVLGLESTVIEDIWAIEMEWSDRREMIRRKYASNLIGANAEIIITIFDFS